MDPYAFAPTPFDFHVSESWRARVERALLDGPFVLACRALARLAGQRALSKAGAARWALGDVAPEHRRSVEEALMAYEGGGSSPCGSERAWTFVAAVESELAAATR